MFTGETEARTHHSDRIQQDSVWRRSWRKITINERVVAISSFRTFSVSGHYGDVARANTDRGVPVGVVLETLGNVALHCVSRFSVRFFQKSCDHISNLGILRKIATFFGLEPFGTLRFNFWARRP